MNKWIITLTVMLPTLIEIVDTSVVNVALDHIRGSLSAGIDESTWTITSYLVSNAMAEQDVRQETVSHILHSVIYGQFAIVRRGMEPAKPHCVQDFAGHRRRGAPAYFAIHPS